MKSSTILGALLLTLPTFGRELHTNEHADCGPCDIEEYFIPDDADAGVCYVLVKVVEIVVEMPDQENDDYVTLTVPYTGTSSLSEPITTTVPPTGDDPGTVIVKIPDDPKPWTTFTVPYTGTSSLSEPITTTVPPEGDDPGKVIVKTPEDPKPWTTVTVPYTGTSSIPGPVTTTIPPNGDDPGKVIVKTPEDPKPWTTFTVPYTGTSSIPGPITTTIPPTGDDPGKVIVKTPEDPKPWTTFTVPYTGTSSIPGPITTTIPPTGDSPGKVVIKTPRVRSYETTTVPYTGTSSIPGPITTTIPPTGDDPGRVVIKTPPGNFYETTTVPYTGTSSIPGPITTTIPPTGDDPGRVVIKTPIVTPVITETRPYTGTSVITGPITSTGPPVSGTQVVIIKTPTITSPTSESSPGTTSLSTTESSQEATTTAADVPETTTSSLTPTTTTSPITSSTTTETPGPTFSCNAGGYLIQVNTLYRLDLTTGENPIIKDGVGPGGNINAMGYNVLDNFLYAFVQLDSTSFQLMRIDSEGGTTLLPLVVPIGYYVGDIDDKGQFWVSAGGIRWAQINLVPDQKTFGQIVDQGTSEITGKLVSDWGYLENGGDYLYAIHQGTTPITARWSRTTHKWEELATYPDEGKGLVWGAVYAVGDELWASENNSGDIRAFPVLTQGGEPRLVTAGPTTGYNDGARCFKAPAPDSGEFAAS